MRVSCSSGSLRFKSQVLLVLLALTLEASNFCDGTSGTFKRALCSSLQTDGAAAAVMDHAVETEILCIVVILGVSDCPTFLQKVGSQWYVAASLHL